MQCPTTHPSILSEKLLSSAQTVVRAGARRYEVFAHLGRE
jgi:hypothetical protein